MSTRSVSNLSPLSYLGWAFWNEIPTLWTAIGACMQILRGRESVVVVNQT